MTRRLGVAAALVDGEIVPGDVEVDDASVVSVGSTPAGARGLAVPGFVDLQVNGFTGVDFTTTDLDGYHDACLAVARTGVTSMLATVPTAAPDRYQRTLTTAAAAVERGPQGGARLLGVHLEGPFLSPARAGAHNPAWLRAPDRALTDAWLEQAPVALMTVAPELEGALELISHLRDRGVMVSLGHSDAQAAEVHAGFDAGATAVTHLWNAQRPMSAREPGVVGVALARPDVFTCVIADLVHVAPDTLLVSAAAAGDRLVVVTDAVSLAGLAEGSHRFGDRTVTLAGGAVRLEDGTLAGSACPMDRALRNLVHIGVPLDRAVMAMTGTPARLLGRTDVGRLRPGGPADVTVLDDDLAVLRVLVGGDEVA